MTLRRTGEPAPDLSLLVAGDAAPHLGEPERSGLDAWLQIATNRCTAASNAAGPSIVGRAYDCPTRPSPTPRSAPKRSSATLAAPPSWRPCALLPNTKMLLGGSEVSCSGSWVSSVLRKLETVVKSRVDAQAL